ncbi:hypothetical protein LEMA_P022980.1 [Plenodomus lingam JN3]|uniref:Macro domain-containing protein n=1 Tax=Leptosphaeria maculans (strain JN3 / isolate v23.1.3 / race Av1-4-5-6-7-8) TaxID=985895 RepID=E5ABX7_LEPMJ|nr:hypothetical protein LEMA_P022980.1 [Plenodomus lingam JN3]CBY01168.1 hypothetical protein LEMA_P022980.1 [Plenodomus lingam JN3]
MSKLRLATAANVQAFHSLLHALDVNQGDLAITIDAEALEDEFGRLRVWSGNLGALQKGHSSLDYRLRDSPLLSGNALKLLQELEQNLTEAYAIVSGARLPYEQQPRSEDVTGEEDDDSFFSDDEDNGGGDQGPERSKTEMSMRFSEVVDIIDNLYKLSVRIRTPTIRLRSLKAASYAPKDPETGVDIMIAYAKYDDAHITEVLTALRRPFVTEAQADEDFLSARLSAAITLRRRQFKYWKRHRDKLGATTTSEEGSMPMAPFTKLPVASLKDENIPNKLENPKVVLSKEAQSQKTGKTLLSGTEATYYHQSLDEIVDTKSVTSYAVTVKDIQGRGVDLPPPPTAATGDRDFECPYCYIICPARYGRGRAWRTHILQDLQPYCCTYANCDRSERLFRSRREWIEHEASHRKVWRCPEHPDAVYKSESGLEGHLRREHLASFPESQLPTIVKVGETTTVDVRKSCPICFAPADTDGLGDFQSHVANHLERMATFALPSGVGGDSDGASGVASRGGSGSTVSHIITNPTTESDDSIQDVSKMDEWDIGDDIKTAQSFNPELETGIERAVLSAEILQQLPDLSLNRVDMVASHLKFTDDSEIAREINSQSDENENETSILDVNQEEETPAELERHLEQREAFKVHLLSMPGATMVRFYKRYGSWTGRASFTDGAAATEAMKLFNKAQFPKIILRQSAKFPEILKFVSPNLSHGKKAPPNRRPTNNTEDAGADRSESPASVAYEDEEQRSRKLPAIGISDIPTLSSLYRSRKLLQSEQSYAPNDTYNQMISFCYYDLTRLKVDAIVNSANCGLLPTKAEWTLNNAVHRAAGPGLLQETKFKAKLKAGQAELSHGHNLPSDWIIHAARPQYAKSKGMGQFNVLTECYRSALKIAKNHVFKTIAFPSLGAGGCGFPPRIAARIALQEVREYLDAHSDYPFQRIVFCVNSEIDNKAYMEFFPVFFPPTQTDLDPARRPSHYANLATLATQVLETRRQLQVARERFPAEFSLLVPDFDSNIISEFSSMDASLASFRTFLLGPQEIDTILDDVTPIYSVLQTTCQRIMETIDKTNDTRGAWENYETYWDRYNRHMRDSYGTDLVQMLMACRKSVKHLDKIVAYNGTETEATLGWSDTLGDSGALQEGRDNQNVRFHTDKVSHAREIRQKGGDQRQNTVKLEQITSLAKLYQLGELSRRSTTVTPSAKLNHSVYLTREDITRLEVDIMVNSTDESFLGMGTLDRSVFKKGGPELRDQVQFFGTCQEGDVKLTPGYMLPAKHILHTIPPEQYGRETQDIMRGIYREVLHTAMLMRATSVAFPSIGTGMLNYPRRDSASLAMEEVKSFLESADSTNSIEKIIFVVYSSDDEFVYKSLLPVYFPPVEDTTESFSKRAVKVKRTSMTVEPTGTSRRTLFSSIGEALRHVRPDKQPEISRDVNSDEEHYLISFESHAEECTICKNIDQLYAQGLKLCSRGYAQAQLLLAHMHMIEDQSIHTKPNQNGHYAKLMVPPELYPLSVKLLQTVEKSFRDNEADTPFVSLSKNYAEYSMQSSKRSISQEDDSQKSTSVSSRQKQESAQTNSQTTAVSADLEGGKASHEQSGGTFGGLPSRIKKLMGMTSSMSSSSRTSSAQRSSTTSETEAKPINVTKDSLENTEISQPGIMAPPVALSPLAQRIVDHMTHDLRTRPGSYLGQTIADIVSSVDTIGQSPLETLKAVQDLSAKGYIHNTTDQNTWVLSHPPSHLPPLSRDQIHDSSLELPANSEMLQSMTPIKARVLSYLDTATAPTEPQRGRTIHNIATALDVDTMSVWAAIRELEPTGYIQRSPPGGNAWILVPRHRDHRDLE